MCPYTCVNHIYNGLAKKKVDELGLNFFSPNIIIIESIGISMWELNKVHDIGTQSMSDKENKGVVQNRLESFRNDNLLHFLYT